MVNLGEGGEPRADHDLNCFQITLLESVLFRVKVVGVWSEVFEVVHVLVPIGVVLGEPHVRIP